MAEAFVPRGSITINASGAKVWDALLTHETIKQYMPVMSVVSEWRAGSPIVWKSEFQDKPFEARGTVLRVEPGRLLEYDPSLPIFRASGAARSAETYQRVTIELQDEGACTHVSVTEQNDRTRRELEHSKGSWRMALHGMKALLEGTSVVPMRSEERR